MLCSAHLLVSLACGGALFWSLQLSTERQRLTAGPLRASSVLQRLCFPATALRPAKPHGVESVGDGPW